MMVTRWRWWFGDEEGRSGGEAKVGSVVAIVVTMMGGGVVVRRLWVWRRWWCFDRVEVGYGEERVVAGDQPKVGRRLTGRWPERRWLPEKLERSGWLGSETYEMKP
ncbi:hypothetical protein Tco_0843371 [Tanacetum coccineum]|uniref:Transmembrane protein n=1 Tax=Tanacetum coccineum TaxID=301880 RepID=A0ABQ5B686_9ASTR